jgi:phosphoribosyl 1,2-cyclic phosphate phosphodiesterase
MGPSLFVHGPDLLIDTPEEIKLQLNRAGIERVAAAVYSHWHPDHTMGRRVFEDNLDWRNWPPQHKCTDVFVPLQVAEDFRTLMGTWEHLSYLEHDGAGVIRLVELADGGVFTVGSTHARAFPLAQRGIYGFVLEEAGRRVLIVPDDLLGWQPSPEVQGADLAIIPIGLVEVNPLTGERAIPREHPVLQTEATFRQTLELVPQLRASRVILTHVEEPDGLTYDDLLVLGERFRRQGLLITFAYDGMIVDV